MKRRDRNTSARVERPDVDAFINDLRAVCRKHCFSIGHEDTHGAFLVWKYRDDYDNWLSSASIAREEEEL